MLQPKIQPSDGLSFRTCSVFIFMVLQSVGEQSQLICPHQPIVALAGDDVILPCHLEPPINADSQTVVWTRTDLNPKYIHYHEDGRLNFKNQNPSYHYRTRLFVDELKNGNVSMKIFRVKLSDTGKYFCILRSVMKDASIQLTVGVVSTPVIEFVSSKSREVVLQCEAKGWYPEPEVFWLDGEGNLLSAGPTETVRGPDDLYTVSRRLTVEKSDNFTCRVQQKNIKQTRETHLPVFLPVPVLTVHTKLILGSGVIGVCLAAAVTVHGHGRRDREDTENCDTEFSESGQEDQNHSDQWLRLYSLLPDNQEAAGDEMTTEQTLNDQKNTMLQEPQKHLKPSITLQQSHEEPKVRSQSENRRDGGTVEETVQTPGQCGGETVEVKGQC